MEKEGFLWFTLGVGCVLAYKLTIYQLESYKRQCEIIPEETRETVDKATENALKLDTLSTLSKGVNYNLSRAAIRIIAERAVSDEVFPSLLRKTRSPNLFHRHEALKTLRFLVLGKQKTDNFYENDNDHVLSKESVAKLQSQAVHNALVRACINALPRTLPDGTMTIRDEEAENYALECLYTLIKQTKADFQPTMEAGLATYMKRIPTPNHPDIVAAFTDKEYQPENYFLFAIHFTIVNHTDVDLYFDYLRRAGLRIDRAKVLEGLRITTSFERQVQTFHRTMMERYPEATSIEEALAFASEDGANPLADAAGSIEVNGIDL